MKQNQELSDKLRMYRKRNGITQKKLALEIGIVQTAVANYETGKRNPDLETLIKLADFFNTSLDKLTGRDFNKSQTSSQAFNYRKSAELTKETEKFLSICLSSRTEAGKFCLNLLNSELYSEEQIFLDLLIPSLQKTGDEWNEGIYGVEEEHLISETILECIISVHTHTTHSLPLKGTICSMTPSGEQHTLGLRIVSYLLEHAGWKNQFLGAQVPAGALINHLRENQTDILLISVTLNQNINTASGIIRAVRREFGSGIRISAGGAAVSSLPEEALKAADLVSDDIVEIINWANQTTNNVST